MATVEELRKQLTWSNSDYLCWSKSWGTQTIDSLIAAAEARGVAKGAAAEREKIFAGRIREFGDTERDDFPTSYEIPASVLAPTKEKP